jgi:hypothetical protein
LEACRGGEYTCVAGHVSPPRRSETTLGCEAADRAVVAGPEKRAPKPLLVELQETRRHFAQPRPTGGKVQSWAKCLGKPGDCDGPDAHILRRARLESQPLPLLGAKPRRAAEKPRADLVPTCDIALPGFHGGRSESHSFFMMQDANTAARLGGAA